MDSLFVLVGAVFVIAAVIIVFMMVKSTISPRLPHKKRTGWVSLDPAPGYPLLEHGNQTWEVIAKLPHSNPTKITLQLRRGREEQKQVTFNIYQFINVYSLESLFFPVGPTTLRASDGRHLHREGGREEYAMNWAMITQKNATLERELVATKTELLNLNENYFENLKRDKEKMWLALTSGKAGAGEKAPKS